MAIKKIKIADTSYDVQDSRITGIDSTPTSGSTNVVTSGGIKAALDGKLPIVTKPETAYWVTYVPSGDPNPCVENEYGGWDITFNQTGSSRRFQINVTQLPLLTDVYIEFDIRKVVNGEEQEVTLSGGAMYQTQGGSSYISGNMNHWSMSQSNGHVKLWMNLPNTDYNYLSYAQQSQSWITSQGTVVRIKNFVCEQRWDDISTMILGKEDSSNKVTSISSSSTDAEYPSAKCVYDAIDTALGDIETLLAAL